MSVKLYDSGRSVTQEDLTRAEERMGCTITATYRDFLLSHNGGRPEPNHFSVYGKNGALYTTSAVDWFFGINTGAYYNSLEQHFAMVREHRVPPNLLPIAGDPGGNLICLSVEGADVGTVYFWDHEEEADDSDPPTYGNVFFIASSFDAFLNGLHDNSDQHQG